MEQQKETAIRKLMEIKSARRGQISAQYYERQTDDGHTLKVGPYYVWQRWVKGQKISARIPPEHIKQVKADLERGRDVQKIGPSDLRVGAPIYCGIGHSWYKN